MTRETARQLLELYFRHGKEQDAFLQKLSVKSDSNFAQVRAMIGKTMGSMYVDAIHPILSAHPDLTPIELQTLR